MPDRVPGASTRLVRCCRKGVTTLGETGNAVIHGRPGQEKAAQDEKADHLNISADEVEESVHFGVGVDGSTFTP